MPKDEAPQIIKDEINTRVQDAFANREHIIIVTANTETGKMTVMSTLSPAATRVVLIDYISDGDMEAKQIVSRDENGEYKREGE